MRVLLANGTLSQPIGITILAYIVYNIFSHFVTAGL
jgi:hypothetical protein